MQVLRWFWGWFGARSAQPPNISCHVTVHPETRKWQAVTENQSFISVPGIRSYQMPMQSREFSIDELTCEEL